MYRWILDGGTLWSKHIVQNATWPCHVRGSGMSGASGYGTIPTRNSCMRSRGWIAMHKEDPAMRSVRRGFRFVSRQSRKCQSP